jgi:FkbH-like protein
MDEHSRPRLAQMTQKTNQFNTTTRRYTEADLETMVKAGVRVVAVNVEDKFGNNGLTGCIIIRPHLDEHAWSIDNFLLSCRVMSRNIEYALFGYVLNLARQEGISIIYGEYIPTPKNKPVEGLYERLGFRPVQEGLWQYSTGCDFSIPAYFSIA